MKAAVLANTGPIEELKANLSIQDLPIPEPLNDEVVINIKYASLNHRDLWITKGMYGKIKLPIVLGSDGAGVIFRTGNDVSEFKPGDEVIINPSLNWGEREEHQVRDYKILGMPDNGTLAEYICINKKNVFLKPSHLSLPQAAAIPLAGLTAYRACIVKACIKENDNVLITGIGGGVAAFSMQVALSAGATVFVSSGSDEKIQSAIDAGAKGGANYHNENWHKEILALSDNKIDIVIDSSGGDTITKSVEIASYGARIVSYGATHGAAKEVDMHKLYWKQLKLMGSTMGSDNDFVNMLKYIEQHKIIPVIDETFELENIHEAFYRMDKGVQSGKIIIKIA